MITCRIESLSYNELRAYMDYQANDSFPNLKDQSILNQFSKKLFDNAHFCICRDGETPIGMIAFYANGRGSDSAYIPHVYVSPEYRRQGLLSKMMHIVEEFSKEQGFSSIRLEVDFQNLSAQNAYARYGFQTEKKASPHSCYMIKTIM